MIPYYKAHELLFPSEIGEQVFQSGSGRSRPYPPNHKEQQCGYYDQGPWTRNDRQNDEDARTDEDQEKPYELSKTRIGCCHFPDRMCHYSVYNAKEFSLVRSFFPETRIINNFFLITMGFVLALGQGYLHGFFIDASIRPIKTG